MDNYFAYPGKILKESFFSLFIQKQLLILHPERIKKDYDNISIEQSVEVHPRAIT